ncbi:hypothetical protein EVAR_102369_1 [Eumeta japonica]|uniref:Uncharacterized protein n=1 Tax=Eumeta variegata TaxID=151549 RepID=A0A4C1SI26_EUMVA|nr:hypothetical protein EVAR_102369_1 [Eumeta japonica]
MSDIWIRRRRLEVHSVPLLRQPRPNLLTYFPALPTAEVSSETQRTNIVCVVRACICVRACEPLHLYSRQSSFVGRLLVHPAKLDAQFITVQFAGSSKSWSRNPTILNTVASILIISTSVIRPTSISVIRSSRSIFVCPTKHNLLGVRKEQCASVTNALGGVAWQGGAGGAATTHYPAKTVSSKNHVGSRVNIAIEIYVCVRPNHTEHRPLRQHAASSSGIDCGPRGRREETRNSAGACGAGRRERSRPLLPDILLYTRS